MERPGYRYRVWTPKKIRIEKSADPLKVICRAPGNREKVVFIQPDMSDAVAANVFNGFLPGALYDHESGALYSMPDRIVVDFTDMMPQEMPKPDYQQVLDQNPALMSMEEFRPGMSALQRDKYVEPQPLQPRRSDAELFSKQQAGTVSHSEQSSAAEGPGEGQTDTKAAIKSGGDGGDTAESLTRQMNPQVFAAPDGFVGGTPIIGSGGAAANPAATDAGTDSQPANSASSPQSDFDAIGVPVHIYPK